MRYVLALLLLIPTPVVRAQVVRLSMGGDISVAAAPDGARLRTMGGEIRVKSAGGRVIAKTMGGGIHLDRIAGSVDAGTMGGEVEVEVIGGGTKRTVEIHTMGGDVELTLPAGFAADFEIELQRDDDDDDDQTIVSDFPLKITESLRHRWFKKVRVFKASGTNGSGGNRVRISAIGGTIRIRRS